MPLLTPIEFEVVHVLAMHHEYLERQAGKNPVPYAVARQPTTFMGLADVVQSVREESFLRYGRTVAIGENSARDILRSLRGLRLVARLTDPEATTKPRFLFRYIGHLPAPKWVDPGMRPPETTVTVMPLTEKSFTYRNCGDFEQDEECA